MDGADVGWRDVVVEGIVQLSGAITGRRPRIGPLRDGVGAGRFRHSEWTALLQRFVQQGKVEYTGLARVRRLVEIYLGRLAEHDPETFIDADDQLAFYLNAYNAIVIHQVITHYPVASIRAIPAAFLRPYPIGRRNVSLHWLHSNLLRSFNDPRIHAAICAGANGSPLLASEAYVGNTLQRTLDHALRQYLADQQRGVRFDESNNSLVLPAQFRWYLGDFVEPYNMPGIRHLAVGWSQSQKGLEALRPWLPPAITTAIRQQPVIRFARFDWSLNERQVPKTERLNHAM